MSYSISQAVRELAEPKLAEFTAKLLPTVDPARILGVRTPALRKLSQKLLREHPQEVTEFKAAVPHDFQEEDLLHVLLLNEERDFATWHAAITSFLPYMTNWTLTDAVCPACVKGRNATNLPQLERACLNWLVDDRVYVQRLGVVVLMSLLGTEYFSPEHLRGSQRWRAAMSTMCGLLLLGILRRRWLAKNVQLSPGSRSPIVPAVPVRPVYLRWRFAWRSPRLSSRVVFRTN